MDSKIIVALDLENKEKLQTLIEQLDPRQCRLKIGKTLFTHYGPQWVKELQRKGFDIFLDLKFHDIPQQVHGACSEACALGVWMVNVHAMGGLNMLKAARNAIDGVSGSKPKLIGVTLLTSLNETDLYTLGIQGPLDVAVMRLAALCYEAGLDGVVCSAQEAPLIKKNFGKHFLCVTPGIRLPNEGKQDQQRIMAPQDALASGSDYLVIGRSITHASSPLQVLHDIHNSLKNV